MDYKGFSKSLRDEALFQRSRFGRDLIATELESAATAIETLLAERDAAVEQIRGACYRCANARKCYSDDKMMRDCVRNNRRNWQWRGPQKEDGSDDQTPEPTLERRSAT